MAIPNRITNFQSKPLKIHEGNNEREAKHTLHKITNPKMSQDYSKHHSDHCLQDRHNDHFFLSYQLHIEITLCDTLH